MSAEVIKFPPVAGDVIAGLRSAADRIEAGEFPDLRFVAAVFVDADCAFRSFCWGPCSVLEAIGALARAVKVDLVDG